MSEEDRLEAATPEVETEEPEQVEAEEVEAEPEAEETEETEESGNSEDGDDAPAKPKKRKTAQERISELTAARRQAEREAEYWRQYAEQNQQQRPAEVDVGAKPKLADFEYDDAKYEAALDEWHQKRFTAQRESEQKRQQEFQQASTQAQKKAQSAAFIEQASEQFDDFAQVFGRVPVSEAAADVILASSKGPAVAYYLGKNPEEAHRIYSLPEHMQAYEIARIEGRVSPPPKPQQKTGAPPPPKKVKPSGSVQKHPDEMTTKEWLEWRNKQLSK